MGKNLWRAWVMISAVAITSCQQYEFSEKSVPESSGPESGNIESCPTRGHVKWLNDSKGFGFITPDDGSKDLFAHFSEISMSGFKTLKEGQAVCYVVKMGPKGLQAANIRPIDEYQ